jgi:hypothetical protein
MHSHVYMCQDLFPNNILGLINEIFNMNFVLFLNIFLLTQINCTKGFHYAIFIKAYDIL